LVDGRSGDASLAQVRLQALSVECSFCDSSWGGERAVSPRAFVHHPFLVSNLNLGMYRHSTILSYGHDRGLPRLRLRLIWSCSVAIGSAFALPARQRHLIHEADLNNLMAGNLSCILHNVVWIFSSELPSIFSNIPRRLLPLPPDCS
jgi:hypothetical protein